MTKEQLRTLATLPKVLEALRALVKESDGLRELLGRVHGGPTQFMVPPGMVPPEIPRMSEPTAPPPKRPKTLAELPAAQRRAIQGGVLSAQDPIRAAKLAQFKHDGPPGDALDAEGRSAHATQETIDTLSEAS